MYEADFPVPEGAPAAAQTEDTGDASRFMAGSLPLDGAGPMGIIYDREQELYAAVPALDDNGPHINRTSDRELYVREEGVCLFRLREGRQGVENPAHDSRGRQRRA